MLSFGWDPGKGSISSRPQFQDFGQEGLHGFGSLPVASAAQCPVCKHTQTYTNLCIVEELKFCGLRPF